MWHKRNQIQIVTIALLAAMSWATTDLRAEIQPSFDMNSCCERSKRIVVGSLEGNRLTVTQVLSSVRMGMATIELPGNYGDRHRQAMGKELGEKIEVVAFLNDENRPVLGVAAIVAFDGESVYLMHYSLGAIGLEQLEPAAHPKLTRKKFIAATMAAIAEIKQRKEIAKLPRSPGRAEKLVAFLDQLEKPKVFPTMAWRYHQKRQVAKALTPAHPDEEGVLLRIVADTINHQRRAIVLQLIGDTRCSSKAFEPVLKWTALEHPGPVRVAAIMAMGRIDNHRAVDHIVPRLKLDDPDLDVLLRALYVRDERRNWIRNSKAVTALETLMRKALKKIEREEAISSDLIYMLLGALDSYFHPEIVPVLIEWSISDHPTARQAQSFLHARTGLDFDRERLDPPIGWLKSARAALTKSYDLSDVNGVDAWIETYQNSDEHMKRILDHLWHFERNIPEDHLLKIAKLGQESSAVAKKALRDLWYDHQLAPRTKEAIVGSFLKVKLVEIDQPGIARGSRELRIIGSSNFSFPDNVWVENNSEIAINRDPSKLDDSWGSRGLHGEKEIVFGSMGGGKYLGQPVAKAVLVLRELDRHREKAIWSHKWELGPIQLKPSGN